MPEFSYRVYSQGSDRLLAITDSSILGRTFEEGDLSIKVKREFYKGKTCDDSEALELIRSATIVNAVGRDIIGLMKKEDIIDENAVLVVNGVPHAQFVRI